MTNMVLSFLFSCRNILRRSEIPITPIIRDKIKSVFIMQNKMEQN